MTPDQLEALIELMESIAIEAAQCATDAEASRPQEVRDVLRRVYAAFGIAPPAWRGLLRPGEIPPNCP